MPRPITAVRWATALFSYVFGLALFVSGSWEFIRSGGVVLPARPVPIVDGGWQTVLLILWFACAAYTGWRGMEHEAAQ